MPDDSLLETGFQCRHLIQWHAASAVRLHGKVAQQAQSVALVAIASHFHVDQLIVFAVLAHRDPGKGRLQRRGQVRRGNPHGARPVLIHHQTHHLAGLFPIEMHVGGVFVITHFHSHPTSQLTHLGNMLSGNTQLNRIPHRRTVFQSRHASTHCREFPLQDLHQPATHLFAFFHVTGEHHKLGHTGGRQFLIQRQIKTGRATAHVAHVVFDHVVFAKHGFQAQRLFLGRRQRRPFLQLHVHHQLKPAGRREELLGHKTEQKKRKNKDAHGQPDDRFPVTHAPLYPATETAIKRFLIRVMHIATGITTGQTGEQLLPQIRHKDHRRHPGSQQCNGHHLEDGPGIFPGARFRSGDGQKACSGNQGAGEHGKGGTGPGKAGSLDTAKTLLHFYRHHFHGDNGIVHHQAQCQHQRTQRNLVQADVEIFHRRKGHGQHQRNGKRHYQTGAPAQ